MLIETLAAALLLGVCTGGKISRLGSLELRKFWLIPLALLLQGAVYWASTRGITMDPSWLSPVLDTGSYFLLLIAALLNISQPGMKFIMLGILLNTIVISINGGVMPVDPAHLPELSRKALSAGQGTHGLMTTATHLKFLADCIYLGIPYLKQVFSVGDCLIDIGCFILVWKTLKVSREKKRPQQVSNSKLESKS